jgi:GNAT superfamily N-acetyltransferase
MPGKKLDGCSGMDGYGSMNMTFRAATPEDHDLVVEMLCELVIELGPVEGADRMHARLDDDIRKALVSPNVRVFLAFDGSRAAGLSRGDVLVADPIFRLRDDQRCGYVDQMYVRPAYRNRGLGRDLLRHCENWFRQQGIGHALLHAAPKAMRFYEREGYQSNRELFKRL